jgi:hypothetical protein
MNYYEIAKRIVENCQAEQVDGMWFDMSSANIYIQIMDALNEENKAKLSSLPLVKQLQICWDLSVK